MIFYRVESRQDFASYYAEKREGSIRCETLIDAYKQREILLSEYLGEPPRKPGKKGDFLKSADSYFVNEKALELFKLAANNKILTHPIKVIGRENEILYQIWVVNFVDCLDLKKTVASPASGFFKKKIGVIKKPIFDESRWDGSDLFVVPQDPNFCFFCTERFVAKWKESKLKGIEFSRFLMDQDSIKC